MPFAYRHSIRLKRNSRGSTSGGRIFRSRHHLIAYAGDIDSRVAQAQLKEAQLRKQAADLRSGAVDSYNKWQAMDARVRTLARPESMPVPPPTSGEPTR